MKNCEYCLAPNDKMIDDTNICDKCREILKNPEYGSRLLRGQTTQQLRGKISAPELSRMLNILERNAKEAAIRMRNQKKADS